MYSYVDHGERKFINEGFVRSAPCTPISRFRVVAWTGRSPELHACDFWVYLKSKVIITKPNTVSELKKGILN